MVTDHAVISELQMVIERRGAFPTANDLRVLKHRALLENVYKCGGLTRFRMLMGYELIRHPNLTDDYVLNDLRLVCSIHGRFPTTSELGALGKGYLSYWMGKHGGTNKFRAMLGYGVLRHRGIYSDEYIIKSLQGITNKIGNFPTNKDLDRLGMTHLASAIPRYGGYNKFRLLMGYGILKRRDFWSDETVVTNLKDIIQLIGYFPTENDLTRLNRNDLTVAIIRHGGYNKFRVLLGYELIQKSPGHWTDETIIRDLKIVILLLGYFPSESDLDRLNRNDLTVAIDRHGGYNKFRRLLGYPISEHKIYLSDLASYINKRGHGSEKVVKEMLVDWCYANKNPIPIFDKKLAKGDIIEIVCDMNKKIGIDVTNTKIKDVVVRKWRHKDYYKYLDELWIVVFSNVFSNADYEKWNTQSPPNVKVMPIEDFLDELNISTDKCLMNKISNYKNCTFRSKEELKQKYRG